MKSNGRLMAGTLDSRSDCPCEAQLIPSVFLATYSKEGSALQATEGAATPAPSMGTGRSSAAQQSSFASSTRSAPTAFSSVMGEAPGFYIVPKSMTREALETTLFPMPPPSVMRKFQALNPDRGHVKAGSLIVLSDPNNFQCTREEAWLMQAAAKTEEALQTLSADEADFMARHHAEIASFLSYGSTAVGVGEAMFANYLNNVKAVLQEMEALHQRALLTDGHLRSPAFFAERERLLATLDTSLNGLTRKGAGLPDHPNLKSALGIFNPSLVHPWTKAGAPGQLSGYATHIDGVAKASKYLKYGGWIGTAVGGGGSYMKVQDVCRAGNTEACERVKFTEAGSFVGGVAGGVIAGYAITNTAAAGLCVALGLPTGGLATLACGVVLVGVGSYASGAIGEAIGEGVGEIVYEVAK
ncbi:MAG: PAAR domain-containing protein [Pseudomonas sp.]|uniref:PAAR domain-containing protein n=1 Tax=Pseudomonas sp. TaxID=306 RepID=UPI003D6E6637